MKNPGLVALFVPAMTALFLGTSVVRADGEVTYGERLDPSTYGPGIVETMAVALELRVRGDRWLLEPQFRGSGRRPQEPHEEPAATAQPDKPASLASSG